MLIPVCCFSCGACIGHLWETYNEYVEKYNKQLITNKIKPLGNNDEVIRRINNTDLPAPSAEELALISLNVNRLCCRRMFLTQSDTYKLVNLNK